MPMKVILTFLAIAVSALWLADCTASKSSAASTASSDPMAANRAKYLEQVRREIAGKENLPADSVFTNIKVFKKMPADRLMGIMDRWGETLGVSCDHCHVLYEWASEAKAPKEITRQMVALTNRINNDIGSIKALKNDDAGISCYTCHRGDVTPARRPKK